MTSQLVLQSKDIINDYPKPKQSLNGLDCKPSKPKSSNSSMTPTFTIINSNQNNKNIKNTKQKLLNENDGKIKSIQKREEMNTKNIQQNHANNDSKNDPIKVQNEFMDAMTNAIIRFLEKNPESNKRLAEESVFIALGYDASIEYEQEEPEENDNDANNEDEDEDEDEDIDIDYKTKHRQSFLNEIKHYRRHHIMRDRDAIRTFRIKQLHGIIMQQHPTFQSQDVLQHLTKKLSELYLPSPSPPPIIEENKENISNQHETEIHKLKINKDNKNKTISSKNARNTVKLSDIVQTKNLEKICKDKSINVTINESNDDDKKIKMTNNNNGKNEVILCNAIDNDKYRKNNNNSQENFDGGNNNNNDDKCDQKDENDLNLSPSQIYITVNDIDPFGNNLSSRPSLKYNRLSNPSSINKQGIGFQNKASSKCNSYTSSTSSLTSSSPFIDHYQTNATSFINDKLSNQSKYFVSTFNNEDDEVLQKMKLHKKTRKRKGEMNSFENGAISQMVQPPKKRVRFSGNTKRSKKLRNKNKTRVRGRNDRKSNRNPYGNQQQIVNRSTDCFDDEEDDGSDIDLNPNTNNLLLQQ